MVRTMANIENGFECIDFEDYEDLAEQMILDEGKLRVAVLPYYHAIELAKTLINDYDVGISYLDYDDPEFNEYDGEYYVAIDDADRVSIEPCHKDDKFILAGGDILYIYGETNSSILRELADEFEEIFEIGFIDADEMLNGGGCEIHPCYHCEYNGKWLIDGKYYTMERATEFVNDWLKVMDEI